MSEQEKIQSEKDFFQSIQEQSGFKIMPCETNIDFTDEKRFEKLKLTSGQKMQISGLLQHIPTTMAAGAMSGAYTVRFPKGLPHTLMALKRGGFGSQIVENHTILGSASFYPMLGQAAVLGVFTAMSVATGQFFLAQINKELHMINKKLEDILKFLYRDKRAELLSELNFVKYAYENYGTIMEHDSQRIATICNIQEAKKIAMQDIEFYISDLKDKIESIDDHKKFSFLVQEMDDKIELTIENLDFSLQLYLMSSLMEVYYAQNYEQDYIDRVESSIKGYVKNCNDQVLSNYGTLRGFFGACGVNKKEQSEKEERMKKLEKSPLDMKYNAVCENLYSILHTATKSAEYYVKKDENDYNIYYKIS